MSVSVRVLGNEELLAALLRDAAEEFEDSSQGQGARDRFRDAVMGVADRLAPPVRLVADPLPQSGARRLLTALESLEDTMRDGNDNQSVRV